MKNFPFLKVAHAALLTLLAVGQASAQAFVQPDEAKFEDCYHSVMQSGGPSARIPEPQPAAAYKIVHWSSKDIQQNAAIVSTVRAMMPAGAHETADVSWNTIPFLQSQRQLYVSWLVSPKDTTGSDQPFKKVEMGYRIAFKGTGENLSWTSDRFLTLSDKGDTSLFVPDEAELLTYWFKAEDTNGTIYWDSQNGTNYRISIRPNTLPDALVGANERTHRASLVCFYRAWDSDGGEWLTGYAKPLQAGSLFYVGYDVNRLKAHLRGIWHNGLPAWDVFAHVNFYDGHRKLIGHEGNLPLTYERTTRGDNGVSQSQDRGTVLVPVQLPAEARSVDIWFTGKSYGGTSQPGSIDGTAWDSNFGQNWSFPVYP